MNALSIIKRMANSTVCIVFVYSVVFKVVTFIRLVIDDDVSLIQRIVMRTSFAYTEIYS